MTPTIGGERITITRRSPQHNGHAPAENVVIHKSGGLGRMAVLLGPINHNLNPNLNHNLNLAHRTFSRVDCAHENEL